MNVRASGRGLKRDLPQVVLLEQQQEAQWQQVGNYSLGHVKYFWFAGLQPGRSYRVCLLADLPRDAYLPAEPFEQELPTLQNSTRLRFRFRVQLRTEAPEVTQSSFAPLLLALAAVAATYYRRGLRNVVRRVRAGTLFRSEAEEEAPAAPRHPPGAPPRQRFRKG